MRRCENFHHRKTSTPTAGTTHAPRLHPQMRRASLFRKTRRIANRAASPMSSLPRLLMTTTVICNNCFIAIPVALAKTGALRHDECY